MRLLVRVLSTRRSVANAQLMWGGATRANAPRLLELITTSEPRLADGERHSSTIMAAARPIIVARRPVAVPNLLSDYDPRQE